MESQEVVPTGRHADVHELVRALLDVTAAIDHARSVGLELPVPSALFEACMEVVARQSQPDLTMTSPSSDSTGNAGPKPPSKRRVGLSDVPLRKLIWHVISPGEEFTVADVVQRLVTSGVPAPANKVSNALGYWAGDGRLIRHRKGVYSFPIEPPTVGELTKESEPTNSSTLPNKRAAIATRRKEAHLDPGTRREQQAM